MTEQEAATPSTRVVLESAGPQIFPQIGGAGAAYDAETKEILRQIARAMGIQLAREHHAARLAASTKSQAQKP